MSEASRFPLSLLTTSHIYLCSNTWQQAQPNPHNINYTSAINTTRLFVASIIFSFKIRWGKIRTRWGKHTINMSYLWFILVPAFHNHKRRKDEVKIRKCINVTTANINKNFTSSELIPQHDLTDYTVLLDHKIKMRKLYQYAPNKENPMYQLCTLNITCLP